MQRGAALTNITAMHGAGTLRKAALVATVIVCWLTCAGAPAHATTRGHRIAVVSTFTDPGVLAGARDVRCGYAQPNVCELTFVGHSTVSGTMTGYSDYTLWVTGNPDGSQSWHSYERFTGTVGPCGRGTFDFVVENGTIDSSPEADDPLGRHLHGTWSLVPDSGTGALRSLVSGGGDEDGTAYADSSNKGDFTGSVVCR